MRIIAQKSNNSNTYDFLKNALTSNYIDSMSFNVTYTKDDKVVIYNSSTLESAITNTINNSTLNELQGYEITLLDKVLQALSENQIKKGLYINMAPVTPSILNDENIKEITIRMNEYVDEVKRIVNQYQDLTINIHSIDRGIVTILKEKISNLKIGFIVTGIDLNFVDVDYYVLISSAQNDSIIDMLLKNNKDVIIYVYSEYYISYLYEHYLGEKSTPYLQQTFQKLGIMSNYPAIIHKVFET